MNKKNNVVNILLILACFIISGCASKYKGEKVNESEVLNKKMYLATNLHADRGNENLSSVNFQVTGSVIKYGTPVIITKADNNINGMGNALESFVLTNQNDNKKHMFSFHGRTLRYLPYYAFFKQMLTDDIEGLNKRIDGLSSIDKQGIDKGIVMKGMSKDGVKVAIGAPPVFENKDLDTISTWIYYFDRKRRFSVIFDSQGKVENITGYYQQ